MVRSHDDYDKEIKDMLYRGRLGRHPRVISQVDWGILGRSMKCAGEEATVAEPPDAGVVLADPVTKEDAKATRPLSEPTKVRRGARREGGA